LTVKQVNKINLKKSYGLPYYVGVLGNMEGKECPRLSESINNRDVACCKIKKEAVMSHLKKHLHDVVPRGAKVLNNVML
jgi:hypothetical protein